MMRLKFDINKSMLMKDNPKRGIDFYEVQEIWSHPYYEIFDPMIQTSFVRLVGSKASFIPSCLK